MVTSSRLKICHLMGFFVCNVDSMLNLPLFALIPLGPRDIGVAKYFASVMLEATKAHSVTSSPAFAFITESVNREAAYAILSVADPAPSLAFTTSVPASLKKGIVRKM